jgi:competence protein ComEC
VRAAVAWLEGHSAHLAVASGAGGLVLAGVSSAAPLVAAVVAIVAGARLGAARTATLVALALIIAGMVGTARLEAIDGPGARLEEGQRVAGRAHLRAAPRLGPFGASAEISVESGPDEGARLLARFDREVRFLRDAGPGVEVAISGVFHRVESAEGGADPSGARPGAVPVEEGQLDFAAHLRRRGVAGELDVDGARLTGARRGGVAGALDAVRARADAALVVALAPTAAGLARGMVLGADETVPTGTREDFRDSGLAHLLAASGQNVLLLTALAAPLLALAGVSHSARIPVLLLLIALYVPIAGGEPSIQRAGVMGAAALLAVALARPASRWYALGLAACATLALNPRACGEPGWQLSFAAVIGILVLAPGIRGSLDAIPRAAADGIALTTAATVATAPLLAHHFGTVPLAGLGANVAALPLVAPIMWLGMLRATVGQALPATDAVNDLLGAPLAPLLAGLERLAALFADAPGGQLPLPLASPLAVALAYVAIAAAVVIVRRARRRLDTRASTVVAYVRRLPRTRQAGLAVASAALLGLLLARGLAPAGPPATLTVTFLDVGQGDATLIQHPDGSAVLFDGGPPEAGAARLLRRAGVRRLSALVMTHASRDHHGGLAEVVERFPVELLLDGGDGSRDRDFRSIVARAEDGGATRAVAVAPLTLRAGSLRIDVLSPRPRPPGPPPEDPNPRAIVAIVSCDGFELLLSGDAESESLLPLALPDVEAMKLPHHGSADPGLPAVLERLQPEVASIPVGANSYGHPAPSTLAALRDAEVPTWRTDRNGSVRVAVEHGAVQVEAARGGPVGPAVAVPAWLAGVADEPSTPRPRIEPWPTSSPSTSSAATTMPRSTPGARVRASVRRPRTARAASSPSTRASRRRTRSSPRSRR